MFHFIYEQSNFMLESILDNLTVPLRDPLIGNISSFDHIKCVSFNSVMEVIKKVQNKIITLFNSVNVSCFFLSSFII